MKFLEYSGIDAINSALVFETPECRVYGRVEPYSCKMTFFFFCSAVKCEVCVTSAFGSQNTLCHPYVATKA